MNEHAPGLLQIVWRWRLLLAAGACCGLAASVFYWKTAERMYAASAEILVEQRDAALPTRGGDSPASLSVDYEELLDTHARVLKSPRIVADAVRDARLDELPGFAAVLRSEGLDPAEHAVPYIAARLASWVGGDGGSKAHVVSVDMKFVDPDEVVTIVEAVVAAYRRFVDRELRSNFAEASDVMLAERRESKRRLAETREKYAAVRAESPLLYDGEAAINPHVERLTKVEAGLVSNEIETLRMTAVRDRLEAALKAGAFDDATMVEALAVIDDDAVSRMSLLLDADRGETATAAFQAESPLRSQEAAAEFDQLLALRLEEKDLERTFGPGSLELTDVRGKIAAVEEFLDAKKSELTDIARLGETTPVAFVRAYIRLIDRDLASLAEIGGRLAAVADRERDAARRASKFEIEEAALRDELARDSEIFDTVSRNLAEVSLIREYGGFVTEVLNTIGPAHKVWPAGGVVLPAGLVAGLGFAFGLSVLLELLDRTFRSVGEVERRLGLRVVATVGRVETAPAKRLAAAAGVAPALPSLYAPRSPQTEALRTARTLVRQLVAENPDRNAVLVTGPGNGEGKSLLAANVAVLLARSGQRVVLVDCDRRRPAIAPLLGRGLPRNLERVVRGDLDACEACVPSAVDRLDLLLGHEEAEGSAETPHAGPFVDGLHRLRDCYDVVLMDGPPLNGLNDALVLAHAADHVLLNVAIKRNGIDPAVEAVRRLEAFGVRPAGCVVQMTDKSTSFSTTYGESEYTPADPPRIKEPAETPTLAAR